MPYKKRYKEIPKSKNIYRYFYSWYLFPVIFLHELTHIFIGVILGVKITNLKFVKDEKYNLYNGVVTTALPNKKWKQYLMSYSPMILLIVFLLIPISNIFIFISIYFLSTIFKLEKWFFILLPSKEDVNQINIYDYHKYLKEKIGDTEYEYYRKKNDLLFIVTQKQLKTYEKYNKKK